MHILLKTTVAQPVGQVASRFNRQLFEALNPPFPPVRLLRFDGSRTGDEVHLELNFLLFRQVWKSRITDDQSSAEEISFVDEGIQLPFFLSYWRHRHRIIRVGNQSQIVDDITFRSPFFLMDFLLYPVLYLQFLYRKPIYRRYFK